MTNKDNAALELAAINLLNDVIDDGKRQGVIRKIFDGVNILRDQAVYQQMIVSYIASRASGISPEVSKGLIAERYGDEIKKVSDLLLSNLVERAEDMISASSALFDKPKTRDVNDSLVLALDYAGLLNGDNASPSKELVEAARKLGDAESNIDRVGQMSVMDVMSFLSNPYGKKLGPAAFRMIARLNDAVSEHVNALARNGDVPANWDFWHLNENNDLTVVSAEGEEVVINDDSGPQAMSL